MSATARTDAAFETGELRGSLIVNVEFTDSAGGRFEEWAGPRLVDHGAVLCSDPDVTLRRTEELDQEFMAGTADGATVARDTIVVAGDREMDVLGTPGVIDRDLGGWTPPGRFGWTVLVPDSPFGEVPWSLEWDGRDLTVTPGECPDPLFTMTMRHRDLLEWLWGDALLGHFFGSGLEVAGEAIFGMSLLEGLVSAPASSPPPRRSLATLARLAETRRRHDIDSHPGPDIPAPRRKEKA